MLTEENRPYRRSSGLTMNRAIFRTDYYHSPRNFGLMMLFRRAMMAIASALLAWVVLWSAPATAEPRKEAFGASLGKIVLFHGNDVTTADNVTDALRQDHNLPVQAIAGGPSGKIELFINRQGIYGPYSIDELNNGTVYARVVRFSNDHGIKSTNQ